MHEEEIFHQALARGPEERAAYLEQACAGDPALRASVEALLRANVGATGFLERPAPAPVAGPAESDVPSTRGTALPVDPPPFEGPGAVIGPYKLLQQIGEGGMGTVFMAEQTHPVRRKVALKVIKPGMDSRNVIARFEAERQALAMMDHVNIARVFDAGATQSGRPYFVMELVHGVPITKYCDDNCLTPRERLELFVLVCQAIQHAHQKGIIHRDVKPSNVMVTLYDGKPVPKVIDFGVAKATEQKLTERTLFTQYGTMVGTLEYMSPEQAEMSALGVDTRSDIYSLGVLLYELLTGSTPLSHKRVKEAAYAEILRMIKEEEPPRPSTRLSDSGEALASISAQRHMEPDKLTKLVRGELDWIVMKSLEKDRGRRYETASAFAADVQRYLHDEPVLACPPSGWYRFGKFARRNKAVLVVAGLALCFLVLLGGGVGWVVRDQAARELAINEVVTRLLQQADELQEEGNWLAALAVVKRAEVALTGNTAGAALERRVREQLANLLLVQRLDEIRLRRSQGIDYQSDNETADREYAATFREHGIDVEKLSTAQAAVAIRSRAGVTVALAGALDDWAYVRRCRADKAGDAALTEVALAADPDPFRRRLREAVIRGEWNALEQLAAAEDLLRQPPTSLLLLGAHVQKVGLDPGLRVLRKAQQEYPSDFWISYYLGQVLLANNVDRHEAISCLRAAVAIRPQSSAAYGSLGFALEANGQRDEAIACYHKAIKHQLDNVWAHVRLGKALREKGQPGEAVASYRRALALNPDSAAAHRGLAWLRANCPEPAFRDMTEAVLLARRAVELLPTDAGSWTTLGAVYYRAGDWQAARTALEKAQVIHGGDSFIWFFLAMVQWQLGEKEKAQTRFDEAVRWMDKNQPRNEELAHFRAEAAELMKVEQKKY
jgi:serine/threonine protein kinase/Flp pilus assembly protein TadD